MLKLSNIKKIYTIGKKKDKNKQIVNALNGVSLEFREKEFVSVLGQSGCGKTTLLNIIGGLDKYTSGDLIINGKSTKEYKDKDWDTYRNHTIGFVFQSYNLIPHLNVLQNVELALTLSGISKKERIARAQESLKKVGLEDKLKNKPNQLSGGQLQRVAIARALVNDPDIILADEPTGALDSKTSVQIMELLKKISDNKLIIMVTHNSDLAKMYSSRIVTLKDGCVIDDTMPYSSKKEAEDLAQIEEPKTKAKSNKTEKEVKAVVGTEPEEKVQLSKPEKKKKMSFFTALSLSFKNLITKKARTILISFAGSIGIIGIALILAVSTGFQGYINRVQEETLSNYPLTIETNNVDYTSMIASMMGSTKKDVNHSNDAIYSNSSITTMLNQFTSSIKTNDLESFYTYLQSHYDEIKDAVNDVQYSYKIPLNVYNGENKKIAPTTSALYEVIFHYALAFIKAKTITGSDRTPGLLIEYNELTELYTLIRNSEASTEAQALANTIINQYLADETHKQEFIDTGSTDLTMEQIVKIIKNLTGVNINNYALTNIDAVNPLMNNITLMKSQYDVVASTLGTNVDVLSTMNNNQAVLVLDNNSEINDCVLYALGLVTNEELITDITNTLNGGDSEIKVDYSKLLTDYKDYKVLVDCDYYVDLESDNNYVNLNTQDYKTELNERIDDILNTSAHSLEIVAILRAKTSNGCLSTGINYKSALVKDLITYHNESLAVTGLKDGNPVTVAGGLLPTLSEGKPSKIEFYMKSFSAKSKVEDFIKKYNDSVPEEKKISYTDYVGLIVNSVTSIINGVTYVLVAFVSISLMVSSIMIGIITYISVLERIKEIGVLRSIGASKRDVKRVFTAESLIIGFSAGAIGIIISVLLTIPINIIIKSITSISGVAVLNPIAGVVLIGISMLLTFISGLIPAKIASKKDPVIALRTE